VLLDSRRERLCGIVVVAPIAVEAWTPVVVGMTGVISFRTTAPMPLYTVRGRACPIREVDVVVGAHAAPSCAGGLTRSSGEAEVYRGGRALPCLRRRGQARRRSFSTGQARPRPSG
jgi:hypothetical protein